MRYQYEAYTGEAESGDDTFSADGNLTKLKKKYSSSRAPSRSNLSMMQKDCRERLCQALYGKWIELYEDNGQSRVPMAVYIKFAANSTGDKHPSNKMKKFERFAELIFNHDPFQQFYMSTDEENDVTHPVLAFSLFEEVSNYSKLVTTASFLFWIFRKDDILDWCLDYAEGKKVTFRKLCLALSKQFLEDSSWGDSSNEVVALSVFAYFLGKDKFPTIERYRSSGPYNFAVNNIPFTVLNDYVRDIVLPYLKKHKKAMQVWTPLDSVLPIQYKLADNLAKALRSLILSESMES